VADSITIFRGSSPEILPGRLGTSALWPGFLLEWHEIPAGEYGDSEFHCHLVAVERSPLPYRLGWKEDGFKRTVSVQPGTAFVRSQQLLCSLRLGGTQRVLMLCIDPRALELALPEPFTGRPVELIPRPIGCDASVNYFMAALEAEAEAGAPGGELLLGSIGKTMALYLACRHATRPLVLPARRPGLSRDRLSRVLEYIHAHVAGDLSLDGLAEVACLSSYHFGRMFKVSTGQSVHQFVLSLRIDRSKTLLRRRDHSLAEVAAAAGFCDQSQFTTVFGRATGVTPGVWRREFAGD
jgi:AraC family transcriptional regulator